MKSCFIFRVVCQRVTEVLWSLKRTLSRGTATSSHPFSSDGVKQQDFMRTPWHLRSMDAGVSALCTDHSNSRRQEQMLQQHSIVFIYEKMTSGGCRRAGGKPQECESSSIFPLQQSPDLLLSAGFIYQEQLGVQVNLDAFSFLPFSCRSAAAFGIIVLLRDLVSTEL